MYLRLIFSLLILSLLFYWVGTDDIVDTLLTLNWEYVVYFLLFSVAMIWASSLKWRLFIKAAGHDVSIGHLMKLYTIGYFFNTFMPSTVGGDVARSFQLGKHVSNQGDAFAATFLERFTGLLAMALLGVIFVLMGSAATKGVEAAVLVVGFISMLVALVCFSKSVARLFFTTCFEILKKFAPAKISEKLLLVLAKIEAGMRTARNDLPLFIKAMGLSLFFHVLTVANTYLAARAVNWEDPSIQGLFVVVPLVLLVGMVPLTPNGLGIQEGAFLFFLKRIGATDAQALSVGIVLRVKLMLIAAVGCILWSMLRPAAKEAEELPVPSANP